MTDPKLSITLGARDEASPEVQKLKRELETLGKIKAFEKLKRDTAAAEREWRAAQQRVAEMARDMKAGGAATRKMAQEFEQAKRQATSLKQAYLANRDGLQAMRQSLASAGVDTRRLGDAQKRLQQSTREAQRVLAAKSQLKVAPYREVRAEIGRLRAAYDTLKKSGTLSTAELIRAKRELRRQTAALKAETGGWTAAIGKAHAALLGMATAGYAFIQSFRNYSQFRQRMAEIDTIADTSRERMGQLSDEIRRLALAIPQTAGELAAAEYDIISAGVSLEKSTRTLALSSKAAVAGVTDTKTAANTGISVINAYGKSIDELDGVYDILFQTVKSGVTTFPQLAQNIGEVLPTARAADVQFQDVAAAIAAMTKAGIRTPQAATALKGAINAMAAPAPEARKQFAALGITWQGLIPTLEQIRQKSLSIDQLRLLIPDVEARTGVLALTQNFESLEEILGKMDTAAGAMQKAYDKMKDTPENQIKLLKNEFTDMLFSASALAAEGLIPLFKALRWVMDGMREMDTPTKITIATLLAAGVAFKLWKVGLGDMVLGMIQAARQMGITGAAAGVMSNAWQAAGLGMKLAFAGVVAFTAVQLVRLGKAIYEAKKAGDTARQAAERAAAANDKAVDSLSRWKGVTVPDDIAGRAPEELEELQDHLWRARLYYQQLVQQMERTGDQKGLEEAKKRLAEVRKGFEQVKAAVSATAETMEKPAEAVMATTEQLDEFEKKAKDAYQNAKAEAEKYAAEIEKINRRIAERQVDTEDKIRELKRANLSDDEKIADIRLEAIEKLQAAQQELSKYQAEDSDQARDNAKRFFDDAARLWEQYAGQGEDATREAISGLEDIKKGLDALDTTEIGWIQKMKTQAEEMAATIEQQLEQLTRDREAKVTIELRRLEEAQAAINDLTRDETKHIYVTVHQRTVEENAAGGAGRIRAVRSALRKAGRIWRRGPHPEPPRGRRIHHPQGGGAEVRGRPLSRLERHAAGPAGRGRHGARPARRPGGRDSDTGNGGRGTRNADRNHDPGPAGRWGVSAHAGCGQSTDRARGGQGPRTGAGAHAPQPPVGDGHAA